MKKPRKTTTTLRIARDYFVFSAAHFAVLPDGDTEPLHGHNYQVSVAVEGEVSNDEYIVQFADLKSAVRQVIKHLNHKTIIPELCSAINITQSSNSVTIETNAGKTYVLPISDTAILPINNSTVEALSSYIATQIMNALPSNIADRLNFIHVSVEESVGQGATTSMEY